VHCKLKEIFYEDRKMQDVQDEQINTETTPPPEKYKHGEVCFCHVAYPQFGQCALFGNGPAYFKMKGYCMVYNGKSWFIHHTFCANGIENEAYWSCSDPFTGMMLVRSDRIIGLREFVGEVKKKIDEVTMDYIEDTINGITECLSSPEDTGKWV
jgi:hypothetical protein